MKKLLAALVCLFLVADAQAAEDIVIADFEQETVPLELALTQTDDGPRLTFAPAKELHVLRDKTHRFEPLTLKPGDKNPLDDIRAELVEVRAEMRHHERRLTQPFQGRNLILRRSPRVLTTVENGGAGGEAGSVENGGSHVCLLVNGEDQSVSSDLHSVGDYSS